MSESTLPTAHSHPDIPAETPPRTPVTYWTALEELKGDPDVERQRHEEFKTKPELYFDAEAAALADRGRAQHPLMEAAGFVELTVKNNGGDGDLSRRDFLKLSTAALAFATAGCGLRPTQKIVSYVKAPEELTLGVPNFYASTLLDREGTGVLVKTREGRPIKLEGNPDHPLAQGKLSARGQLEIFNLYDPDRLNGPVKLVPGESPEVGLISWDMADTEIGAALAAAKGRVALLSETVHGPARTKVRREFVEGVQGRHYRFDGWNFDTVRDAQERCYGTPVLPRYHFDRSNYFLVLGGDPLTRGYSTLEWEVGFGKTRRVEEGRMSKLVVFEPLLTLTGANADERYRVRPAQLHRIALAIVDALASQGHDTGVDTGAVRRMIATQPAPEALETELGLPAGTIRRIAGELWENRGRGLVYAAEDESLQILANLLNSICGNEGVTVDGTLAVSQQAQGSTAEMVALIAEMNAGRVDVLVIQGTNPAYWLPPSAGFVEALSKVKTVVYLGDRVDETGRYCHYVLPTLHFLESWGDAEPQTGMLSLTQPAIYPLHDNRAAEDSLLAFARAAKAGPLAATTGDWHQYLIDTWRTQIYAGGNFEADYEHFFTSALRDGVLNRIPAGTGLARSFRGEALAAVQIPTLPAGDLELVVYPSPTLDDGRHANNAWLLEMPHPISKVTWTNYASLSPATAERLGVAQGDVVRIETATGAIELPVHVQPGETDGVVSVQLGWGRKHAGRVANGTGVDAFPLRVLEGTSLLWAGIPCALKPTGAQVKLAITQPYALTLDRPILFETTVDEYRDNPKAGHAVHGVHSSGPEHPTAPGHESRHEPSQAGEPPSLWPEWEYKGARWGMVIDPTLCIGCGACVVACQVENNIPVVGAEEVRRGREMHWLRIDRYYTGPAEEPDLVFQPMLCQHCENAPCETVCPVVATLHNDEGLNLQVYNRCVGTRYCSNNCPYKVRRFNWHEYSFAAYDEHPLHLALNPEVTVREKGVMEKCTFCVHRLRHARNAAKLYDRPVNDADVQTACQQTCPTNAIVFGNINNSETQVATMMKDERSYYVLEELNTRPSIAYWTKLRNRAARSDGAGSGGAHS